MTEDEFMVDAKIVAAECLDIIKANTADKASAFVVAGLIAGSIGYALPRSDPDAKSLSRLLLAGFAVGVKAANAPSDFVGPFTHAYVLCNEDEK